MFILKETSDDFYDKYAPKIKEEFHDEVNAFYKDETKPIDKIIKAFPKEEQAVIYFLITQMLFKRPQVKKLVELGNTTYSSSKDDIFNKVVIKELKEAGVKDIGELNPYGDSDITFAEVWETDLTGVVYKSDLHAFDKDMTSLKGAPIEVKGRFDVRDNALKSLEYSPKKVKEYECGNNKITSLKGISEHIENNCWCNDNKNLVSLEGLKFVGGTLIIEDTGFKSKEDIIKQINKYKIKIEGDIATDFGRITPEDFRRMKMGKFKDFLDI